VLGDASKLPNAILDQFVMHTKAALQKARNTLRTKLERKFITRIQAGEFGNCSELWDQLTTGHFLDFVNKNISPVKVTPWGSPLLAAVVRLFTGKESSFSVHLYLYGNRLHPNVLQLSSLCASTLTIRMSTTLLTILQVYYLLLATQKATDREYAASVEFSFSQGSLEPMYNVLETRVRNVPVPATVEATWFFD
jgi:hypothetical protein